MSAKPKIGLIVGSTRPTRFADKPAQWMLKQAQARGDMDVELIDLRDYDLPFFDEKATNLHMPSENPEALRWQQTIGRLDGFIFVVAEYNHSITAALKNALDEAYREFVEDPSYAASHILALERDNVVMARTFSKAHGLAGLRVGYGIASERIADYAERVRFPVSVSLAAQVAATASMHAREKVVARAAFVVRERNRLQDAFRDANLDFIPSQGNFVMVRFAAADFESSGVLVREGEALGYPGWSRVTVGDSGENYTKRMMFDLIADRIPGLEAEWVGTGPDLRSYRVSFDRVRDGLGFAVTGIVGYARGAAVKGVPVLYLAGLGALALTAA